jgi:hypothetical protein
MRYVALFFAIILILPFVQATPEEQVLDVLNAYYEYSVDGNAGGLVDLLDRESGGKGYASRDELVRTTSKLFDYVDLSSYRIYEEQVAVGDEMALVFYNLESTLTVGGKDYTTDIPHAALMKKNNGFWKIVFVLKKSEYEELTNQYRSLIESNDAVEYSNALSNYLPAQGVADTLAEDEYTSYLIKSDGDKASFGITAQSGQYLVEVFDVKAEKIGEVSVSTSKKISFDTPDEGTYFVKVTSQKAGSYNIQNLISQEGGRTSSGKTSLIEKIIDYVKKILELIFGEDDGQGKSSTGYTSTVESKKTVTSKEATQAYQEYIEAYNKLTDLMSQGKGDTPEAQQAYQEYKEAKEKYEQIAKAVEK